MTDTTPQTTTPQDELKARVLHDFTNHPPSDPGIAAALDQLTELFIDTANEVIDYCPPSRELSMAITSLQEGLRSAKAAVACNQDRALEQLAALVKPPLPADGSSPG